MLRCIVDLSISSPVFVVIRNKKQSWEISESINNSIPIQGGGSLFLDYLLQDQVRPPVESVEFNEINFKQFWLDSLKGKNTYTGKGRGKNCSHQHSHNQSQQM